MNNPRSLSIAFAHVFTSRQLANGVVVLRIAKLRIFVLPSWPFSCKRCNLSSLLAAAMRFASR